MAVTRDFICTVLFECVCVLPLGTMLSECTICVQCAVNEVKLKSQCDGVIK